MGRETLVAVLQRIYADLAFRRRYEQWSEGTLIEYIDADLTGDEWRMLVKYPSVWLPYYSVQPCPQCGGLAVVTRRGVRIHCPKCQPSSEYSNRKAS